MEYIKVLFSEIGSHFKPNINNTDTFKKPDSYKNINTTQSK
jgi:hypothetical protein